MPSISRSVDQDEIRIFTACPSTGTSGRRRRRSSSADSSVTLGRDEEPVGIFDDEVIFLDRTNPGLLQDGEASLDYIQAPSGVPVRRDDFIQVHPFHLGAYEVEFVLIKIVSRDRAGTRKIRGVAFARTRKLLGKLPKKINEVTMILHVQRLGNVSAEPHLVDVPIDSILQKRTLIITNLLHEDESHSPSALFQNVRDKECRRMMIEDRGHLLCRWKLIIYFTPAGRTGKPDETSMERIPREEVPNQIDRISAETLRNRWRGGRIKGGSWCPNGSHHEHSIDLAQTAETTATPSQSARTPGQKYTLFDSFAGAGGVSRGAQSAGFHVQGAIDKAPEVWQTYRQNFPDAELFQMSVDEFIRTTVGRHMRANILHLSPPCQYFSPAHTHMSAQDDTNIFALFSCHQLIDKLRPRLVTLEQTFGITQDRHNPYLRALIGDFTSQGYSIRWKIVRLCTWGLAQDRKRLIMIAAGPGERLPPFPEPTHSEDGARSLRQFTTLRQAISGLGRRDVLHDVQGTKHYLPPRPPLDADRLTGTVTTGGGEAYYPDGTRDFTLREYACLQGFPRSHSFRGTRTSIKRQIGNAFPPNTVQVLYQHLREWLLEEDGITECRPPFGADIVVLNDGHEDEMDAAALDIVDLTH